MTIMQLDHVNFTYASAAKRNVLTLSGGQQQRVAIGRALVSSAPVIVVTR